VSGSAERLRLLILTPYALALDAPHGGRVTADLVQKLARRHQVAVVSLRARGEPATDVEIRQACQVVMEVDHPARFSTRGLRDRLAQLRKLVGAPPALVERTRVREYGDRVREVENSFRPDIVQVEPHEMAQYLRVLRGSAKRVLADHDPGREAAADYSREVAGVRRIWRRLDELAWSRYSRGTAADVDAIVVFSDRDRASVQSYAPSKPVVVIPFQVPPPLEPLGSDAASNRILFFGGYRHPPNAAAARRLAGEILPCVRRRHPSAKLELVGEPTDQVQALAGDSVTVTGRVQSVAPYLAGAAVVAIPITMGGGMRVKVLESLAAGKAVVASSRAVAGLDLTPGREFLLAETVEEFCDAVAVLLTDVDRRVELETAARQWAVSTYEPNAAADAFEALYRRLLSAEG